MADLQSKNRASPKLEKEMIELQLKRDQLVYDKINIKKTEALIEAESYDIQLREIIERMDIKRKQIEYLEGKLNG